jgi:hypothetical protein
MLELRVTLLLGFKLRLRTGELLVEDRWLDPIDLNTCRIIDERTMREKKASWLKVRALRTKSIKLRIAIGVVTKAAIGLRYAL